MVWNEADQYRLRNLLCQDNVRLPALLYSRIVWQENVLEVRALSNWAGEALLGES